MDTRDVLVAIAGLLTVVSALPYILDVYRGKTHPNLVSWVTWTAVVAINAIAAIGDHAYGTAIFAGAGVLGNGTIVAMSIKRGVKKYTGFDLVCQAFAAVGLILWLLTGNPVVAVALSMFVILIAALPTWRHAWIAPNEETWQGFAIACFAGTLTLVSLPAWSFVAAALPVSVVVNCAVMTSVILGRRRSIFAKTA